MISDQVLEPYRHRMHGELAFRSKKG